VPSRTAGRARNRRGEGAKLREDILAAAAEVIEETGTADAVTLREVARRVGIAAPSIYEHFPSREAIADAVIDAAFTELHTAVTKAGGTAADPAARMRAAAAGYLAFAEAHPNKYRLLFAPGRPAHGDQPGRSFTGVRAATFSYWVSLLRDCVAAGQSASDDPHRDSILMWAAVHGYATLHPALPAFPWVSTETILDRVLESCGHITAPAASSPAAPGAAGGPELGLVVTAGRRPPGCWRLLPCGPYGSVDGQDRGGDRGGQRDRRSCRGRGGSSRCRRRERGALRDDRHLVAEQAHGDGGVGGRVDRRPPRTPSPAGRAK
jgi:AcrR family transcriptional regulator